VNTIEVAEDINDEHIESPPRMRYSVDLGKENSHAGIFNPVQTIAQDTSPIKLNKISPPQSSASSPIQPQASTAQPQIEDEDAEMEDEAASRRPDNVLNSEEALPFDQLLEENMSHQSDSDQEADAEDIVLDDEPEDAEADTLRQEDAQPSSPSEVSLPATSVLRKKSSLNFASLPARDPITIKKSLGPRMSRLSQYDQLRLNGGIRESHVGTHQVEPAENIDDDNMDLDDLQTESNTGAVEQSKTSTQRLHEQFAMLGKTGPSRLSKSIPSFVAQAQAQEKSASQKLVTEQDENDDDWIGPISGQTHSQGEHKSPLGFSEAASKFDVGLASSQREAAIQATVLEHATIPTLTPGTATRNMPILSPTSKLPVVTYPKLHAHTESTTPAGSPVRSKVHEGAMSASKNKLFSVLKSAKGLFAGNVAPQPAPETKQPLSPKQRPTVQRVPSEQEVEHITRLNSEREQEAAPHVSLKTTASRRSSDRLRKLKSSVNEKDDSNIMLNSSTTRPAAAVPQEEAEAESSPLEEFDEPILDMVPPQATKSMLPTSQLQKPGELRRPLRAGMRPAPVSIKLASQRVCLPPLQPYKCYADSFRLVIMLLHRIRYHFHPLP